VRARGALGCSGYLVDETIAATLASSSACAPFISSRQLSGSPDEVRNEVAIWDRGLAVLLTAARRLSPLSGRLSQTGEVVELRVDIDERISAVMRAD
jgi:hypothetical protein